MDSSLSPESIRNILARLAEDNRRFNESYPGDKSGRQPVHTVYGGAHLYRAGGSRKLGDLALKTLDAAAPNFSALAKILDFPESKRLPGTEAEVKRACLLLEDKKKTLHASSRHLWLAYTIYRRVRRKLETEPVEDFRIDFEDGYGSRSDEEEDQHARQAAEQAAQDFAAGQLPPFFGLRIKPLSEESHQRAVRTLDLFFTTLLKLTDSRLPEGFVVTLPKVTFSEQVRALVDLLDLLEDKWKLPTGTIKVDLMIEAPQAIINQRGENTVNLLVRAGRGRVVSAAFGTFDYTAACNITAAYQDHKHPAADFARHVLQVSLAGTGVSLSDGITTRLPIGPHRASQDQPLTSDQIAENQVAIQQAWKLHYDNIRHSLAHGYYQGWDLHPAQLPIRYATVYLFFLEGLTEASARLKRFIDQAARATLSGGNFDDAATGQGLLNFFLRGLACGALEEDEVTDAGLSIGELKSRSFVKIVEGRSRK